MTQYWAFTKSNVRKGDLTTLENVHNVALKEDTNYLLYDLILIFKSMHKNLDVELSRNVSSCYCCKAYYR